MQIPDSFIQDVLARTDVVAVVGRYVPLKKVGTNFQGLCPFHGEKTPSFTVSPSKQFFHCFGCGKSGNVIGFLMEHLGMGFVDAVQDLASSLGMVVPQAAQSPAEKARALAQKEQKNRLTDALACAAEHYHKQLAKHPQAWSYIEKRGLSPAIIDTFQLGYAPDAWRGLAAVFPDYAAPELRESGLVIEKSAEEPQGRAAAFAGPSTGAPAAPSSHDSGLGAHRYDRFRDRIMFPIRNLKGECIGFGGRVLHQGEPKYLNSPETPVFSKGQELYGLFEGRQAIDKAGYALVTEGYMDVVALAQLGFANAVATLGTACTEEHIRKLLRFTRKVVFGFDGDAAGRRAAQKALRTALPFAQDDTAFYFLFLPLEHDPDSYIRAHGADAFARLVTAAVPLSQMLLEQARQGCDLGTIEGRSKLASQARSLWQPLPSGAGKRQILQQIAQQVELAPRELLDLWQGEQVTSPASASGQGQARRQGLATTNHPNPSQGFQLRPSRPVAGRTAHTSRIDRALGILYARNTWWDVLSAQDHAMLCAWPAPYGPLFTWLESQLVEHGPQSWDSLAAALQKALFSPSSPARRLDDSAAFVLLKKQVAQAGLDPEAEKLELLDILPRLREDARRNKLAQLAQEAMHDPSKYEEYKRLLGQSRVATP